MQASNVIDISQSPNTIQQIPLVNSTQLLTQSSPLVNSEITQSTSVTASNPGVPNPQISISYAPIVSAIKQPEIPGQVPIVKVIPIYD